MNNEILSELGLTPQDVTDPNVIPNVLIPRYLELVKENEAENETTAKREAQFRDDVKKEIDGSALVYAIGSTIQELIDEMGEEVLTVLGEVLTEIRKNANTMSGLWVKANTPKVAKVQKVDLSEFVEFAQSVFNIQAQWDLLSPEIPEDMIKTNEKDGSKSLAMVKSKSSGEGDRGRGAIHKKLTLTVNGEATSMSLIEVALFVSYFGQAFTENYLLVLADNAGYNPNDGENWKITLPNMLTVEGTYPKKSE